VRFVFVFSFMVFHGEAGERIRVRRCHALRYAGQSPGRCFSPVLIHRDGE
jgi:hypothetical protein